MENIFIMSFKRIHYDYYNNKIYHWYIDENGTTRREECHPPLEYYVQDNEKKSSITDIFGNPVIKKTSEDRRNIKFLKENFQTCELNISPEIAFLQKRYGNKELTFNINDFQVCTLDIEVASGYTGYSKDHLISIKKDEKTFTSTVYDFEYKSDRDDYLVFDEEKERYVKFNKSCYFTNLEFPSPELAKYPINLISLHFSKQDKIYTFGLQEYTGSSDLVKNYIYCKDEKTLLEKFILFFRKMKVDIVQGWNCLDENELVWLDNKIVSIKDIIINDNLKKYGQVCDKVYTGEKEKYEIVLSNGIKINTSENHIFPYYYKDIKCYKNPNSLRKQDNEGTVSQIINDMNSNDVFLKMEKCQNNNKDLTYKELLIEFLDDFLEYDHIDFVIKDLKIKDRILKYKKEHNLPIPKRKGTYFWKAAPIFWKYKDYSNIISKEELIEFIKKDEIVFMFNQRLYDFDINQIIDNDLLKYCGYVYTNGSLWRKQNVITTTTIDKGNAVLYRRKLRKYFDISSNIKWTKRNRKDDKKCSLMNSIDIYYSNSPISLLLCLIYNKQYKKEMNVSKLSKLSNKQFINFFSGLIDGDGWISNYNNEKKENYIGYCDYTKTGIKVLNNLLLWNSVFNMCHKNSIIISCIEYNKNFINNLKLNNKDRKDKLSKLNFYKKKNRISNKIKYFEYDDCFIIKVKSINKTNEMVKMYDISTSSNYFISNSVKTHNCKNFDLTYIINRCKRLGIELSLSPVNEYREKSKQAGYHVDGGGYEICGISTLDGLDLYKNFVYEKEVSYNLNDIGMKVVGEGKLQYAGSINDLWKYDWNTFVEYNIQDVILTRKIELKKRHIDLAINLCYRSLVPFEKVFSSVNLVTGSVIRHLHQNNMVLNDFPKRSKESKIPGAFCYAKSGYYKYAINFDVTSLYPHMVMMYNISLETLLKDVIDITDDIQVTPLSEYKTWIVKDGEEINVGGIYYRKDKVGILPTITKEMFDQRVIFNTNKKIAKDLESNKSVEELYKKYGQKKVDEIIEAGFKSDYYDSQQMVRKIWINALYGCMTNEFFPMFSIENGMTVTLSGQELIKYLSNGFNNYINKEWSNLAKEIFNKDIKHKEYDYVLLNDTDSATFHLEPLAKSLGIEFKSNEEFEQFAIKCEKEIIQPFFDRILKEYADSYKAPNIIKFKRENITSKIIILAKKKYALEIINSEGDSFVDKPKIKIKGIEIIKTDTSLFSRKRLRELVDYIFETEDKDKVLDRIAEIKEEFMKQDIFDIAISKNAKEYTKWCKPTEEYIKEGMDYKLRIPMHIKAAQNYNYFVKRNNLPYQEIANGNKVKFVYVFENNLLNTYVIGFMGKFPDEFQKEFNIDYETQWEKSFVSIIQRFFDVLGWGKINSDNLCLDELWELCQ